MTDLDAMAPIITPERSVPETEQIPASLATNEQPASLGTQHLPSQTQSQSGQLTQLSEQQLAKLQSELDVVQGNMRVLSEMLAYFTSPDQNCKQQPDSADLELLNELHSTCKAMQERVVDLIGKLAHDEMTAELLRINDELNNLFLRYTRYTKNKMQVPASTILAQTIAQPPNTESIQTLTKREAESLIDLSDDVDNLTKQMNELDAAEGVDKNAKQKEKKEGDNDEFDMFAQSRNATYETTKNSSKYEDNLEQVRGGSLSTAILNRNNPKLPQQTTASASPNLESEFNEMAAWLDRTPGGQGDQESLTSSEFERFLAERAAAAEALPTLPTTTTATSNSSTTGNQNIQRQINKDQDKSLFAL
ncbi:TM1L2 protein, partial [Acromyrmex heyeri]